jgi:uncharacterized membrane protein YedE/YeeE
MKLENFSPFPAAVGGALIGLSAGLLWLANGRLAGISGIFGGLIPFRAGELDWRLAFLLALILGAVLGTAIAPSLFPGLPALTPVLGLSPLVAIAAGLMVGAGTRLGGGCTSGHGICGLARFSRRSVVAVLTFMSVAMVTVFVTRHIL